ncbi:copper homeostasis periplasmic binding protein CopC [Salmonella enterica]|nr:copper homeostasis periplasmic binding protein CopC [Salmonella enterica]
MNGKLPGPAGFIYRICCRTVVVSGNQEPEQQINVPPGILCGPGNSHSTCTELLLSSFFTTQAQAHAHLKSAEPAAGSTVESAPGHLTLHFTEAPEPTFSAADVTDSQGNTVKTEKTVVDDTDKSVLIVPLEDVLPSGKYTVNWHVVAVDGHKTKGDYTFTVK